MSWRLQRVNGFLAGKISWSSGVMAPSYRPKSYLIGSEIDIIWIMVQNAPSFFGLFKISPFPHNKNTIYHGHWTVDTSIKSGAFVI